MLDSGIKIPYIRCIQTEYRTKEIQMLNAPKILVDGVAYTPMSHTFLSITEKLVDAIARGRQVSITYCDKGGKVSERNIEPHTFMWVNELMVMAWCHKAKSFRSFLVNSFVYCNPTMVPFTYKEENQ